MDWTLLGITESALAMASGALVAALLAWRLPMAPLAAAIIVGSTVGGLILALGDAVPTLAVVGFGLLAALAGWLYDRGTLNRLTVALAEALAGGAALALAVPGLVQTGLPLLLGLGVVLVPAVSLVLRRADRLPGLAPSIVAALAGILTLLAALFASPDVQWLWWLGTVAALSAGIGIVSRARAAPLAAAGTSHLALTLVVLGALLVLT